MLTALMSDAIRTLVMIPLGILLIIVGIAYTAAARFVHQRWGGPGLAALWLVGTISFGPLLFLHACLQPMMCDAGPLGDYLSSVLPRRFAGAGLALGLATAVVVWLPRPGQARAVRVRLLMLGVVAVFVGVVTAAALSFAMHRLNCAAYPWRRPDGSYTTSCEYYRTHD